MPNKILMIYVAGQDPPRQLEVDAASGGFQGGEGKWHGVCRVDFYDPAGGLLCIFPCDSSTSTVHVTDTFVQLNLQLLSFLGRSSHPSGFDGNLQVTQGDITAFFAGPGAFIDNQPIVPNASNGVDYLATLQRLRAPAPQQEFHTNPTSAEVDVFGWPGFAFGPMLFSRIRGISLPGIAGSSPVFTLERDIPATDEFGLRHLPPPFSISIALRQPGTDLDGIALRAVQLPAADWIQTPHGSPGHWLIDVCHFQPGTIVEFWKRAVADRYIGALHSVADAEPVSLLPAPAAFNETDWRLRLPVPNSDGPLSLQLLGPLESSGSAGGPVAVSCDGFQTHSGAGLSMTATLANEPRNDQAPWMSFSLNSVTLTGDTSVRVGSIDLALASAGSSAWKCRVTFEQRGGNYWIPRLVVETAKLPLLDVQPGGQDDPDDPQYAQALAAVSAAGQTSDPDIIALADNFRRDEPLVIPVPPAIPIQRSLFLSFHENSMDRENQQLTLTLSALSATAGSLDVLVFDRHPFTVALARLPDLTSTASSETNQFAQWSNTFPEGPGWRISAGAGSFELLLPPQGVGEAMVTGETGEPSGAGTVDFRFSPAAQALLETSSQVQRYAEPGWNLRRVLGYPGERAPGAAVESMQFEMLYGLTCSVTTAGLSLSEMFSRLGGFPGPLTDSMTGSIAIKEGGPYNQAQSTWFTTLNRSWAAMYSQLLSRPGIFELWNQERGFDLVLTDGVSYSLRDGANAIDGDTTTFKGGVHYALALDEALPAVLRNPRSSSAVLSNPRFSALGGYGKQRAGFNSENVIVECETAMGMVESLTVIINGRIGNLWHRAKHVTVYERSVRPSRQFYLEQPPLEGRPLLRKTKEYVEILQKRRAYPESGGALACGFVQGVEFKSVRINVDNTWRTDIIDGGWQPGKPTKGWVIPLWRRDAKPEDVYPRPHVALQLAADPAGGSDSRMCEILNPENVYFYADPSQTTSNTDDWPAVEFIDYCNAAPARSVNVNGTPVHDFGVEPGLGRFTYAVGTEAAQVNIVSQRVPNAMAAALTNVTFMRAQNLPGNARNKVQASAGTLHDHVNNAIGVLRKAAVGAPNAKTVRDSLLHPDVAGSVVTPFASACHDLAGFDDSTLCAKLADLAASAFTNAAELLESAWQSLKDQAEKKILAEASNVATTTDSLKQALLGGMDSAFIELQTLGGIVLADLSAADGLAAQISGVFSTINNDLTTLANQISAASSPDAWAFLALLAKRCQNDLNAAVADIQLMLGSASYLFSGRTTGIDVLQTLSSDLNAFVDAVSGEFAKVLVDLKIATAAAGQDAVQAIGELQNVLAHSTLPSSLTNAATALKNAKGSVNRIAVSLRTIRDSLRSAIISVTSSALNDFKNAIDTALAAWPVLDPNIISTAADIIRKQVQSTCHDVLGNVSDLITTLLDDSSLQKYLPDSLQPDQLAGAIDDLEKAYIPRLDGVLRRVRDFAPTAAVENATNALTLLRAFGAPPEVPGLNCKIPSDVAAGIAYFYANATDNGSHTLYQIVQEIPVSAGLTSAVQQASSIVNGANALKQLRIQDLPTQAILDRLIPNAGELANLNLSSLLPNLAGLDLGSLFSGIKVPQVAGDNVHIAHHVDPQTLQAALDLTLDFPIEGYDEVTLFSIGPATVSVENCVFHAEVHVAGGVGQAVAQTSSGAITADWHVYVAGTEILTFEKTALTFDQGGHLHFDIQLARVRLAAVLQFLADFLEDIGLGGGFSLNVLPSGIQCVLSLPLPDMSFGAFGIANLSLGCLFELKVAPEFAITIGANLGHMTSPFTLTIFILGGAGWFDGQITYTPATNQFTADVSIGILASASLSISLGPISGGVSIYFGITGEYHSAGGLNVGILILIEGHVSLLGILDVDITLLLEAEYTSGGGLIGRGEVDISIKICWCFTLSVHQSVEFTFGNAGSVAAAPHAAGMLATPAIAITPAPDPVGSYAAAVNNRVNYLS